ncbi:hypothetical protein [Actinophytocola gossypii]|uniref:Uncharacterized protein n=1 Tax=Actinophytocola gossypii TaxID=2812003 RepID=A0ABT2JLY7_9PSEU|nr:hypothetical protein [Actinophytocola gossypii]MCT2588294.1 hypothetical protein [Actinophytocola gossypii]
MQRIRPALEQLDTRIGLSNALASRRLYTDGAEVRFDYAHTIDGPGAHRAGSGLRRDWSRWRSRSRRSGGPCVLEAARRRLGTATMKDTVNTALRLAADEAGRRSNVSEAPHTLAAFGVADRAQAWR